MMRSHFLRHSSAPPFDFYWESVSRGTYDQLRRFSSAGATLVRVYDLPLIVASAGVLCGTLRFIVGLGPYYFNRPFFVD